MSHTFENRDSARAVNLFDFEKQARDIVAQMAFDYYAGGANDEITLNENRTAYNRIFIYPRMLQDVEHREMKVSVLGQEISMPIMIAPTAFHKMAHPEGEIATARAADRAGTIMTVSTLATSSIEEVAAASSGNLWFQLYVYRDREITRSLVKRAEAVGCKAIVLTVDSPILGRREKDVRNCFKLPDDIVAKNLISSNLESLPECIGESGLASYIASLYDQSLSWKHVDWLCSITKLPVLIKGILRPDDAELAVLHGAAGIIVSNHGGRQLDTTPATISVLPRIVDAVSGRAEIYLDGGIRRGTDILKALACGARAVFVGRPVLWGLACSGQRGVEEVLELLRDEFDLAMALSGCANLSAIDRQLLEI